MKTLVLHIGSKLLAAVYALLKLLPTVNGKIVFLSRQHSTPSLDFRMLQDELRRCDPSVRIVTLCNRHEPGVASKLSFARDT